MARALAALLAGLALAPAALGAPSPGARAWAQAGCGSCHVLSAAGGTGTSGPSLDALRPTARRVADAVRRGGKVMPSFATVLTAAQIQQVAAYVAAAAKTAKARPAGPFDPVATFRLSCGGCHTLQAGQGFGTSATNLDQRVGLTAAAVAAKIRAGGAGMPKFGTTLTAAQVDALAAFVAAAAGKQPTATNAG